MYGMNARVTDQEANVIDQLIGEFYKTSHAKDMYLGAGKLSPTTQGETVLTGYNNSADATLAEIGNIATATYGTTTVSRPLDKSFNIM